MLIMFNVTDPVERNMPGPIDRVRLLNMTCMGLKLSSGDV
jgi:hypothetical protein